MSTYEQRMKQFKGPYLSFADPNTSKLLFNLSIITVIAISLGLGGFFLYATIKKKSSSGYYTTNSNYKIPDKITVAGDIKAQAATQPRSVKR
jgi:hypothetical protein